MRNPETLSQMQLKSIAVHQLLSPVILAKAKYAILKDVIILALA